MPYIFITVQSGGWDPSLPINLDYSPELDPEINGFLREHQQPDHKQQANHRGRNPDGKGSISTHCELRLILDGLERLGFQLVTTASYSFQGRAHNEFIMHREMTPVMDQPEVELRQKHHSAVPEQKKKKNKDNKAPVKQHRHRDRSSSSSSSSSDQSLDERNNRRKKNHDPTPAPNKDKKHSSALFHSQQQSHLYY